MRVVTWVSPTCSVSRYRPGASPAKLSVGAARVFRTRRPCKSRRVTTAPGGSAGNWQLAVAGLGYTPASRAAAGRVAQAALPGLGGKGAQAFDDVRGNAPEPRMGDLIVLAGLEKAPDGWRPPLESFVPEQIRPVQAGGLLDEGPAAEVMLLGDSNGLRSEFAGRLGRALGREVWNQSQDGGFFAGAMLAALGRQGQWPASLKVVVWQFSELSLSLPLSAAERKALAELR